MSTARCVLFFSMLVVSVAGFLAVSACSSSSSNPSGDLGEPGEDIVPGVDVAREVPVEPRVTGTAQVSEAAVVFDEVRSAAAIVAADSLTFDVAGNEDLLDLEVGAVLVGTAGVGFLRMVESVSSDGGQITIVTSRATLEDLFDEAEFIVDLPMIGEDGKADSACPACDASPWIDWDLSGNVLFEEREGEDKWEKLVRGMITDGHVRFAPLFSFEYVKSFFSGVHYLSFEGAAHFEASIALELVTYMLGLEGTYEFPLVSKSFTLMVGTIPLVLTPQVSIVVDAQALSLRGWGKVTGGLKTNADFRMVVTYQRAAEPQWSEWKSGGFDVDAVPFSIDGSWNLEGKLTGAVKLKASLQVYDIAGPYVDVGPYTEILFKVDGVDEDTENPEQHVGGTLFYVDPFSWELWAGVRAHAGVEASVFGWDIFDYGHMFYDTRTKVSEGAVEFGSCDFEEARTCYFEAFEPVEDCLQNCHMAFPCTPDDDLCDCQQSACKADCTAEAYWQRSRCFDAHGCDVILGTDTEASNECHYQRLKDISDCMWNTTVIDYQCGQECIGIGDEDYAECDAMSYAGIVEDVLGVYVDGD